MGRYYGITWISEKDSLAHYGVLGQKWGVRRFQNEDGTLTDAGKKRYGSSLDEVKSNMEKAQKKETELRRKSEKINSKLLFTTDFSKAHARKKAAKASKEAAEIEGVYDRMKKSEKPSDSENKVDKIFGEGSTSEQQKSFVEFARNAFPVVRTEQPNKFTPADAKKRDKEREKIEPYRKQLADSKILKEFLDDKDLQKKYSDYKKIMSRETRYGYSKKDLKALNQTYNDIADSVADRIKAYTGEYGNQKLNYSRPATPSEPNFDSINDALSNFFLVSVMESFRKKYD